MLQRTVEATTRYQLTKFPCVAILGPRQCGKTSLVKKIASVYGTKAIYLDIERPSDRLKLADAETYLDFHRDKLVVIDEIQFMPELFSILRPLIDEKRKAGRFLLTGSAAPALVRGVSESLAGRIAYIEMTPIGLMELPQTLSMERHWIRGGFPSSLLAKNNLLAHNWMDYFVKSYVERDLNQLFHQALSVPLIRNFWSMLAHNDGGIFNAENYARALGVTGPTVFRYLHFLEGAFLIRSLYPWYVNTNKRLVKAPKVYVRDSGLLHRLGNVNSMESLRGNMLIGASWEGYVIEQIAQRLSSDISLHFYRTHEGAEMDLVLIKNNKPYIGIEIKLNPAAKATKGYYESQKALGTKKNFIIVPKGENFPVNSNTIQCSLFHFLTKELARSDPRKIKMAF